MTLIYHERAFGPYRMIAEASDTAPPMTELLEPDLLLAEEVWTGREYRGPSEISKPLNMRFMRPLYSKVKTCRFTSLAYTISCLDFVFSIYREISRDGLERQPCNLREYKEIIGVPASKVVKSS